MHIGIIESIFQRSIKYFTNVRNAPQVFSKEFQENISKRLAATSDI